GKDRFAYGFKVKIEADVENIPGNHISKAEIKQSIFRVGRIWEGLKKVTYALQDAAHADGAFVDEEVGGAAWNSWFGEKLEYTAEAGNSAFFNPGTKWAHHSSTWLEYSDAPGWPGPEHGAGLTALGHTYVNQRVAIKISAKGTDGKEVVADFKIEHSAKNIRGEWVGQGGPIITPKLPKTWERK